MDTTLDASLDYEQLLNKRAKYLEEVIQTAQSELNKIRSILSPTAFIEVRMTKEAANEQYRRIREREIPQAISQDVVKPLVIEYLKSKAGTAETSEIFEYIASKIDVANEPRRAWVTAISLSLNSLSKGNAPKVRKTPTAKGNIMAYEWIG